MYIIDSNCINVLFILVVQLLLKKIILIIIRRKTTITSKVYIYKTLYVHCCFRIRPITNRIRPVFFIYINLGRIK